MLDAVQIISVISLVLGLVLMLTASLFVNSLIPIRNICVDDYCDKINWAVAAGAFGIIASCIQIISFPMAWFNKARIWIILHATIFIFTLTAYSIAVDRQTNGLWFGSGLSSRAKAFMSFAAIDMTFSAFATGAVYYLIEMN